MIEQWMRDAAVEIENATDEEGHHPQTAAAIQDDLAAIIARHAPRWIPVSERMPELGQWVLLWSKKPPTFPEDTQVALMRFKPWLANYITHWQPIPAAPEPEGGQRNG